MLWVTALYCDMRYAILYCGSLLYSVAERGRDPVHCLTALLWQQDMDSILSVHSDILSSLKEHSEGRGRAGIWRGDD